MNLLQSQSDAPKPTEFDLKAQPMAPFHFATPRTTRLEDKKEGSSQQSRFRRNIMEETVNAI